MHDVLADDELVEGRAHDLERVREGRAARRHVAVHLPRTRGAARVLEYLSRHGIR